MLCNTDHTRNNDAVMLFLYELRVCLVGLQKLLSATDNLVLIQETKQQDVHHEICCPICFEEMATPKQILCCFNGHAVCSDCLPLIKVCPVCRIPFEKAGKPQRNLYAERLVSVYMTSLKNNK